MKGYRGVLELLELTCPTACTCLFKLRLYKAKLFSSPSDLMKSTVVDEGMSTNATRVLFQRKTNLLLQETTE